MKASHCSEPDIVMELTPEEKTNIKKQLEKDGLGEKTASIVNRLNFYGLRNHSITIPGKVNVEPLLSARGLADKDKKWSNKVGNFVVTENAGKKKGSRKDRYSSSLFPLTRGVGEAMREDATVQQVLQNVKVNQKEMMKTAVALWGLSA